MENASPAGQGRYEGLVQWCADVLLARRFDDLAWHCAPVLQVASAGSEVAVTGHDNIAGYFRRLHRVLALRGVVALRADVKEVLPPADGRQEFLVDWQEVHGAYRLIGSARTSITCLETDNGPVLIRIERKLGRSRARTVPVP